MNTGKVIQVIGPVVDIEFPPEQLPAIYNSVKIADKSTEVEVSLIVEVMQHLGDNIVRCVAMSSTDGLTRGMQAIDTGAPIKVPVGKGTLGRVFNVLGNPVDNIQRQWRQMTIGQSIVRHLLLKNKKRQRRFWKQGLKLLT